MKSGYKNCIKVKSIFFFLFIICTNNNFAVEGIGNRSYNPIEHEDAYFQQQNSAYRGGRYNYSGRGNNYRGRNSVIDELETPRNEKDNRIEKVEYKNFSHIKANAKFSHGDNKNINKNIKKDLLPIKRDNDFSEPKDPDDRRLQYSYLFDYHSLLFTDTDTGIDTILAKHGLKNVVYWFDKVEESINRGLCGFRIAVNTKDLFSFLSHEAIKKKIEPIDSVEFNFFVIDYVLPVKKNDKKDVKLFFLNEFIRRQTNFSYPVETALCIDNNIYSFEKTKTNDIFWKKDESCYKSWDSISSNVSFSLSPKRHTVIAISYAKYPNYFCPLLDTRQARITIFNIIPLEKDSKNFYEWKERKNFKLYELNKIDSWFFPNDDKQDEEEPNFYEEDEKDNEEDEKDNEEDEKDNEEDEKDNEEDEKDNEEDEKDNEEDEKDNEEDEKDNEEDEKDNEEDEKDNNVNNNWDNNQGEDAAPLPMPFN